MSGTPSISQKSPATGHSLQPFFSPFSQHVVDVVGLRSEKQVNGIDTRRVVAAVQNVKTIWNRPDEMGLRNAMGFKCFALFSNESISPFVAMCSPKNATGSSVLANVAEDSINQGRFPIDRFTYSGAASCRPFAKFARSYREGFLTDRANVDEFGTRIKSHAGPPTRCSV
jgi:hypothetical protein